MTPRSKEILSVASALVATFGTIGTITIGGKKAGQMYRKKFGNYDPEQISSNISSTIAAYDGEVVSLGTVTEVTFREGRITGASVPVNITDPKGHFRSIPVQLPTTRGHIVINDLDRHIRMEFRPDGKAELMQYLDGGVAIARKKRRIKNEPLNSSIRKLLDSWRSKKAVVTASSATSPIQQPAPAAQPV